MLSKNGNGTTGAQVPTGNLFWPVRGREMVVSMDGGRSFGANRGDIYHNFDGSVKKVQNGHRRHAGVDLYGAEGDIIIAPEDLEILSFYHFYQGTYALICRTALQIINFGEVSVNSLEQFNHFSPIIKYQDSKLLAFPGGSGKNLGAASFIPAGEPVAIIGKLKRCSMLHFEMYSALDPPFNLRWPYGSSAPSGLLDPTPYLLACKSAQTQVSEEEKDYFNTVDENSTIKVNRLCE